ncbi:methyl-CpG-binding domain-containing protein 13 isoform X1 [Lycium barbarum]|uniref:methyl-CpG-binding domain-containing protein 13 isoform X1 n=1 Tax=Lycium barbarum TaxID=112863 RepID=UPI00293E90A5|nr:methyl-CpG-binding domain-containing protein 13 isoform X1 [Lycium barbarum]
MGKKRALPNWLPDGWKVEVKASKQGKKEKWYCDPSKGLKFCSKANVLRYLGSVDSNCSKSSDTNEMEKKGTEKFFTEKDASEGLPPGWIKELKVRRKGRKIRKDPYYIDPVSGQTFRSMKQVSLFLETRESGSSESKTGDQCPGTSELGEPFSSETNFTTSLYHNHLKPFICNPIAYRLPAEADKQNTLESDASGKEVSNQKLKLSAEHTRHSSCVEGGLSSFEGVGDAVPEKTEEEDDGKAVSDPSSGEHQEMEDDGKVVSDPANREHQEKEDDSKFVSDPANGEHQEKKDVGKVVSDPVSGENQEKPSRDGVEKYDWKTIQRKRKKGLNVPRRASKRLAGIKADTSLQLQTNNQAHLAPVRQVEETQAATTDKHVATAVTGITISEKVETGNLTIKGQEDRVTSPLKQREQPSPAEPAKAVFASCEGDKKVETALESSLSDLWTDPCIEFAIKTLTGTIPLINDKKADEIPDSNPSRPSINTPSSVGLPSDEIWADPCFMFAVKTLTGEIPIGDDVCSQKIVQKQSTSSQFQGNNGLVLPNIRFEEFGQPSHFRAPEMSLYKKQPAVAPNAYQNCWFGKFGSHRPPPLC